MREKDLENKLAKAFRDSGGLALKFVSPGMEECRTGSCCSRGETKAPAGAPDGAAEETGVHSICCR